MRKHWLRVEEARGRRGDLARASDRSGGDDGLADLTSTTCGASSTT